MPGQKVVAHTILLRLAQPKCAADLLKWCRETGLSIPQIVRANEKVWWETDEKINAQLDYLWSVMKDCVARGLKNEGIMPGPMKVRRRAKQMYEKLDYEHRTLNDPLAVLDWVNAFAFAANEENACGVGDRVMVMETRPLSKDKRWRLTQIIEKAK